jgi:hypothetical protein
LPEADRDQDFADLLRDTLEELSICDEDDLARCGLPPGWYGTRVRSYLDQDGDSPTAVLVIRLGSGTQYRITVVPEPLSDQLPARTAALNKHEETLLMKEAGDRGSLQPSPLRDHA